MTILAVFNEYNSNDSFIKKVKNIINICKENPSKTFLNEYYSNNFDILTRLVIKLITIRLYFIVPVVFKFVEIIRNIKIYVQKTFHRTAESQGDKTKVTWKLYGAQKFPAKIISLFLSSEKMCGPMFEKGLAHLEQAAKQSQP